MTIDEYSSRTVLPAAVTEASLSGALAEIAETLGQANVRADAESLMRFSDPYRAPGTDAPSPSAVLTPGSVEEVQAVVRWANQHRIALWTVSQGRNNGYGGGAPRVPGSVAVSLHRMDRVLEINEELAYAVVEPGVTFETLYEAVRAGGHKLMISVPDIGWGSVLGNTLDHGWGYTWYGDHAERQCGMEVVLPDGELLRTGMGSMPDNPAWHVHKRGFGPSADGLFMQSNFGIVTKMGVWLMPTPDLYVAGGISVPRDSDLEALVDALRRLQLNRTIQNVPLLFDGLSVASMMGTPRSNWWSGEGAIPADIADRIMSEFGLGRWLVRFALYGPETIVDTHLETIRTALADIPGAEVTARKYPGDSGPDDIPPFDQVQGGIPNRMLLETGLGWRGGVGGHLGFSPVAPLTGGHVRNLIDLMRPIMESHGFDCLSGMIVTPRSVVEVFIFVYDTSDPGQVDSAFAACREMVEVAARHGYGEYRSHLEVMDLVADQYDFNDHALRRFNQKIKDALDPNGILSPGKQGIWPGERTA
ncbi:FAD-binding oxidoreductase [Streptomyces sp. NPDC002143]